MRCLRSGNSFYIGLPKISLTQPTFSKNKNIESSVKLDLSSFEKAISRLEQSLAYCNSELAKDLNLALQFRSAAIHAFEYTYELSWKILKRYLVMNEPSVAEFDTLSFSDLIRTASGKGLLLHDLSIWTNYRQARNITSHTYDENKAAEVFKIIPEFLQEVKYLFAKLQERVKAL